MSNDSRTRDNDYRGGQDDYRPRRYVDRSWIAPTILAAGTFLAALTAAWTSISANQTAVETKAVAETTSNRVDGRMEEMLALARAAAASQATLDEKAAQSVRESVDATRPAAEGGDATTGAAAQAVLDLAAVRAKKIISDAAIEAGKLLAQERKRQ